MHQLNSVPMPPQKQRQEERKASYNDMVLEAHEAPVIKCAIAALSNWMFLAGFVVFPGILCCLAGGTGIGWTAWSFRNNYVWLVDRILM
ncbi:hypothetical protein DER44DRAFT_806495 [Fusarium oxysporum]|nr:hypothetical protein DER44DRAFT_806495 [Fusarium oxysporum]